MSRLDKVETSNYLIIPEDTIFAVENQGVSRFKIPDSRYEELSILAKNLGNENMTNRHFLLNTRK